MTIAKKSLIGALILSFVAIFSTAIIIASSSYQKAESVIQQQTKERLIALREVQKSSIEAYLDQIKKQVLTESNSAFVLDAALAFKSAFQTFTSRNIDQATMKRELKTYYQNEFGRRYEVKNNDSSLSPLAMLDRISDRAVMLQYYFIQNNPNPLGEKDALYELPIDINYSRAHARNHPRFRTFLQTFNFYDIFIIDAQTGQVVYSVFKELDFATSLLEGPYRDSGLADVFKAVRYATDKDAVAFSPFESYTPSYEDPASFIASPIQDDNGKTIAVLAFQMPIDELNAKMTHYQNWQEKGLGLSGETYLVGEDFKAQSISRFLIEDKANYLHAIESAGVAKATVETIANKETNIGFQEIRTQGTSAALAGETGFAIFPDYRNVPVLSAYTPIDFEGSRIVLMVEIDQAEAFAFSGEMIRVAATLTIVVSLVILSIVGFLVWRFTAGVSKQLDSAVYLADQVSRGKKADLTGVVRSNDEVGGLISALDRMQTELIGELERREQNATRVKMALDVCDTNVMMADTDYNIAYMNHSVRNMMIDVEADLRRDLPHFDARNLMGQNIDIFHKNPAHQRGMLEGLSDVYRTDIVVGGRTFGLTATPILGANNKRLGTVVEWDDKTERLAAEFKKQRAADESMRIKQALDNVSANVMVADADRNIIYANSAIVAMFRSVNNELRRDLPSFNVDELIGTSIDQFHQNPAHQMKLLDDLTGQLKTKIVVGGRHMYLTVNPVFDAAGNRLGTVVEWSDKTIQLNIQQELDDLVSAAADGNLSERISMEDKDGFFADISCGLNTLLDEVSDFIAEIGQSFSAMSKGDLTTSISKAYQGEFETIKNNANNSMAKLTEALSLIQQASINVRVSANEVAKGSDDLSRRTEAQASSLEETASSMAEITVTVKQTTDNAVRANSLADEAKNKAEAGGDVVNRAVNAMTEILDSSKKINDIIGVIDEIAFQTNLLALNAAVEAARAGEHGRGFAVVAGEVRTLSQRSAAAAKQIKDLIRDSVNKVEFGSTLVNQSGQTLFSIVEAVEEVASMIGEVNTASREQSSGMDQINQAITQMDEMTQQNAALVEEASAASCSMLEEVTHMSKMISFFKLGKGGNA
ncbi:methyl-accepting chemotaxis sensory transducer [Oleiphilus messinensis]|uniref:Methyl-accepting chemotaxis sensory transducer n=1 Tax=Oleiphilus messinensis TaxID=141451 RepID=A0A1Y0IBT2_9GAMM|nr:methyl-accepting chemotaxis protein [Oleiphilus messinensis]ARU57720.1 methyl-accepting chemotaxis sensory transducer [Oleiphilus messinensis]